MYYRFKTAMFFNYDVDTLLDRALNAGVKSGIKCASSCGFLAKVEFMNGTKIDYWNENKYYAWMSRGTITFRNGDEYNFYDARPTAKWMYLFKCALEDYHMR